jgi:hypothetical protein
MLIDSQGCRNTAIVLVLFVERVRVSLDLSFVAKLATALRQDCFCTPPVLATVPVPVPIQPYGTVLVAVLDLLVYDSTAVR